MIAAAAAAAALAVPLIGTAPGARTTTFLQPETLKPIRGAAKLPQSYSRSAVSPDSRLLAYDGLKRTRIYSVRTGKLRRTFRSPNADLYWLTKHRIVAVDPGKNHAAVVVDPVARKTLRRVPVEGRIGTVAQVGDRLALLVAPQRDGEQSLVVMSAEGKVERTVALPGLRNGNLHPASPDGRAYALGPAGAFAIDLDTGAVTRADPTAPGTWVAPTERGTLAFGDYDNVQILDPVTLAVKKTIPSFGDPVGAGTGFTSLASEDGEGITVFDGEGNQVWHRDRPVQGLSIGTVGDRVYVATGYDDVQVRVYDLATGKLVRHLKGRYSVSAPDGTFIANTLNMEE